MNEWITHLNKHLRYKEETTKECVNKVVDYKWSCHNFCLKKTNNLQKTEIKIEKFVVPSNFACLSYLYKMIIWRTDGVIRLTPVWMWNFLKPNFIHIHIEKEHLFIILYLYWLIGDIILFLFLRKHHSKTM